MTLADIWFGLLAFILWLAVVLDGLDLGVGLLSWSTRNEEQRSLLMGSIGPVWHANLTWLVVLGGLFFGAFPLAYAVVLSALYVPIVAMLFGLIFRGVSFEFREEARGKVPWNLAFGGGSLFAALAQGFALGGLLSGLRLAGDRFAGGVWDWFNPFAALVALGLVLGYLLLGATYLILKMEGELQQASFRQARRAAWGVLAAVLAAGLGAVFQQPFLARRWLAWPGALVTTAPLALGLLIWGLLLVSLRQRREYAPFVLSLAFFALAAFSLAACLYPVIVPPNLTLGAAAAPDLTLEVMLGAVVVFLPLMLFYNAYQYLVFRGKVREGGYG